MAESMLKRVADKLRGKFVVLDGPDGSGKTTQLSRLSTDLRHAGLDVVCAKDPGGTEIGSKIRHILLRHDLSRMAPRCETLLFMASRAQLVEEVIRPALKAGETVLCDRFISATFAYQGALGVSTDDIHKLGDLAVGKTWPALTVVLDTPVEEGFRRVGRTTEKKPPKSVFELSGQHTMFEDDHLDAMEVRTLEFHRRVREIFQQLPELYPKPVVVIDASGTVDQVYQRVLEALERADY